MRLARLELVKRRLGLDLGGLVIWVGRLRVGRGTTRAEDAQGTPTQSHISPSILVYEGYVWCRVSCTEHGRDEVGGAAMHAVMAGHISDIALCVTCRGTEAGSYLRLIDSCITQLKAQGPSRTCNESKEEEVSRCASPARERRRVRARARPLGFGFWG